mgnify:CR=1 FL=1
MFSCSTHVIKQKRKRREKKIDKDTHITEQQVTASDHAIDATATREQFTTGGRPRSINSQGPTLLSYLPPLPPKRAPLPSRPGSKDADPSGGRTAHPRARMDWPTCCRGEDEPWPPHLSQEPIHHARHRPRPRSPSPLPSRDTTETGKPPPRRAPDHPGLPRQRLQEENDADAPSPPNQEILGFRPGPWGGGEEKVSMSPTRGITSLRASTTS